MKATCDKCKQEKDTVQFRGYDSVKKGNPEVMRRVLICDECWAEDHAETPAKS